MSRRPNGRELRGDTRRKGNLRNALRAFLAVLLLSFLAIEALSEATLPVPYDEAGEDLLLKKTINRKPLSPNDERAKAKILGLLPAGKKSGMLYSSPNVDIGYISSANDLSVEILTTDIDMAKKEAVNWFISQGFSQKAICDYPVSFYLNLDVAESLRGKEMVFDPLADGCNPNSQKINPRK
jgi:hypothetical protein